MSTPCIEVKNLKKYFKVRDGFLHATDDVSFKIEKGKTMGIVGESGCGKSTLGRTIIHMHESTGGQIFYNGKDVTKVNKHELNLIHPLWRRKESKEEEEGNESRALAFYLGRT